jgi:hypothetical protein
MSLTRRIFLYGTLVFAFVLLLVTMAFADLTIATGKAGGGYDAAARTLEQRIKQRGTDAVVLNMNGSDEISLALCSGRAEIGFMQIDAIYARALEGCVLQPSGIYGVEKAFLLLPPKSKMDELSDLSEATRVLVDTVGSGSELFWRTIVRIENSDYGNKQAWSRAKMITEAAKTANTLADFGDIDAVLLVRKPESRDVTDLLDLGWKLGELWDKDIDDLKFNGKPLYEGSKIIMKTSNGAKAKNYVYDVRSYIVTTNDRTVVDLVRASSN